MLSTAENRADVHLKLEKGLENLTSAPLKPQQRLYFLMNHLLLSLSHQLVLASTSVKYLKYLDRITRVAVRRWLHLPKDTTTSFFHANPKDGGLGIPSMPLQIPLLKTTRMSRLRTSKDPAILAIAGLPCFNKAILKWAKPQVLNVIAITSKATMQRALAASLHHAIDGHGLSSAALVPQQRSRVSSGTSLLMGANFIGTVKVRRNLWLSKTRSARGRKEIIKKSSIK